MDLNLFQKREDGTGGDRAYEGHVGLNHQPMFKRKSNTFFVLIWTPSASHEDNV